MIRSRPNVNRSLELTKASKLYQSYATLVIRILPALPSDRRYNLTLSHDRRFLWYRVAKVCTRTIFHAFDAGGLKLDAEQAMRCYYPPSHFHNYFKFAFVRNPWDRLASCWRDKVVNNNFFGLGPNQRQSLLNFNSFVDWVSTKNLETCDVHLRLQCRLIDLNHVDFIGRFENFDSDFSSVANRIGLPVENIPHENSSSSPVSLNTYNDETKKRVGDLYAKDIAIFGYDQLSEG